ncbi:MAG: signal peptide peptidase SppA [Spirochaetales bacterium]|nr:signal peptide peptidase SppA [Spirochaetales bacterium]
MDRSRLLVALALVLALSANIVGIVAVSGRSGSEIRPPGSVWFSGSKPGIAYIKIDGPIEMGQSSPAFRSGARKIVHQLEQARHPSVRAVLLEINSPGGSVGATKLIYDEVRRLRKTRPVIAYIPEIAASGGYYIAAAADRIFAHESSLVGSIGVISLHPDLSGLMAQYGVKVQVIKTGRFKDASYPFRSMTPEELEMMQRVGEDAQRQFLEDVADGRGQTLRTVEGWAEARVYSGRQARLEQLITDTGNKDAALLALREMLHTTEELPLLEIEESPWQGILSRLPFSARQTVPSLPGGQFLYLYPAAIPLYFPALSP